MIRERKWTKREIAQLKLRYEKGEPLQFIAEQMERSISAIKSRAQMNRFRRPKGYGLSNVRLLQARAIECGLDPIHLPSNPSALKILTVTSEVDVATTFDLDKACDISSSARNKALKLLRDAGLIFIDN